MSQAAPAWLTELLAEHRLTVGSIAHCSPTCTWKQAPIDYPDAVHRAHVADVVWAEIERRVTTAPMFATNTTPVVYVHELLDALGADHV